MKQITLINDNGQFNDLLRDGLYYGYCNAINRDMIEKEKRTANLVVVCPHENKAYEYYYFFDLRDCMGDEVRQYDREKISSICSWVSSQIFDTECLLRKIYDDYYFAHEYDDMVDDKVAERFEKLHDRLDKLSDEFYDLYKEWQAKEAELAGGAPSPKHNSR